MTLKDLLQSVYGPDLVSEILTILIRRSDRPKNRFSVPGDASHSINCSHGHWYSRGLHRLFLTTSCQGILQRFPFCLAWYLFL